MKLGHAFDPRNNALNAWRLVLATGVILWHSFPLTGRHVPFAAGYQFLSQVFVDGFFAISGFLITSSWLKNPRLRDYFVARGLRIFPGLWVCVAVTAFVIAPISVAVQGGSVSHLLTSGKPIQYVLNNALLNVLYSGIDGTPRGVPFPGAWNGSIWTLIPELLCYIAVAGFGVAGLLRRRWLLPTLMVLMLACSVLVTPWHGFTQLWTPAAIGARFAVMFLAGALLHQYQHVIPARWSLVAVSAVIVLAANWSPNYRVFAAIPLAYAILVSGALLHDKRLRLRTDLSYGVYIYAFPMQQLLIVCGLGVLHPLVFFPVAALATLPLAALSWFLVEKHAIALKSRLIRRPSFDTSGVGD
ncbi:Peptidoglycan/LPS O-acetylase OafA/YrhL, contains acyltransferase and SGNH-hydrolase domains [Mycobacterium numidiamassiliense]|uniref:Peptidoglycan/LPS O-acetylase OafA/YrhL, contains acyltransferase and SGNH-hydrolase domains n=1 Tax=Mycobacterium numidiamassiliense TaxID=1841861 RepID=A0A2U3P4A7_9MYCO|nr:acyltransferase [Mycobacterium numidiamassiliense]SPM38588.1 Peptidoglycan/LPS O-acetylase OafA/YrhL, contains acyltransferase and SGNH-hydrolase domains [Mycobacterium numidiamassiliense]